MACPGEGLTGASYNEILLILPSTLPTPVRFPPSLHVRLSVPIHSLAPIPGVTNRRNATVEAFPASRSGSGIGGGGGGGGGGDGGGGVAAHTTIVTISKFNRGSLRSLPRCLP